MRYPKNDLHCLLCKILHFFNIIPFWYILLLSMQAEWFDAVSARNLDYIAQNLEQCCTLHNEQGLTALMIAAKNGDIDIVKKLVPYEAGQQDPDGIPAAIYAYNAKHIEIMEEILQAEASYRFTDDSDILMYLIRHSCNDVLLSIVHHFPSHIDYNGYSHLDHAVMCKNTYAIELLVNSFEYDESAISRAITLAEEVDKKTPVDDMSSQEKPIVILLCELFNINPRSIASPEIDDLQYYARGNASTLTDPCVDIGSAITGISALSERNSVAFSDALGLFLPDEYGPAARGSVANLPPTGPIQGNPGSPAHPRSPRLLSQPEYPDPNVASFNRKFPPTNNANRASAQIPGTRYGPISTGIYEKTLPNRPLSISGLKAMQSDTENSVTEIANTLDTTLLKKEYSKAIMECERLRKEVQHQRLARLHAVNATIQAVPTRREAIVQTYSDASDTQTSQEDGVYQQDLITARITSSTTREELIAIIIALRKEVDVKNKLLTLGSAPTRASQSTIDCMATALRRQTEANKAQRQAMQAKNDQLAQLHIALQKREQQIHSIQIAVQAYNKAHQPPIEVPTDLPVDQVSPKPVKMASTTSSLATGVSTETYIKLSKENSELTQQVKQLKREVSSLKSKLGLNQDPTRVTEEGVGRAQLSPLLLLQIENIKLKKQLGDKAKLLNSQENHI